MVLLGGTAVDIGVLASDPLRQLTLLEVPPADATSVSPLTLSELQTPTYVVVAEGTGRQHPSRRELEAEPFRKQPGHEPPHIVAALYLGGIGLALLAPPETVGIAYDVGGVTSSVSTRNRTSANVRVLFRKGQLGASGAAKVFYGEHEALGDYHPEGFTPVVAARIREVK